MRRKPQIHRNHRGLASAQLRDRRLAIAGDYGLVPVERPTHLLLQLGVVLDNE